MDQLLAPAVLCSGDLGKDENHSPKRYVPGQISTLGLSRSNSVPTFFAYPLSSADFHSPQDLETHEDDEG